MVYRMSFDGLTRNCIRTITLRFTRGRVNLILILQDTPRYTSTPGDDGGIGIKRSEGTLVNRSPWEPMK